ncbi:MAG: PD-(D/E)XK nuclease family protein, partial [Opitutae bacterium]|nr:PD-(D/E)XK nuclease family protein [Opitutae bacterium]
MSKSSLPQNAKAMGILRNEFSWSKSRNETLQSCPRRYWFHYYGSWGGWDWQSDPRTREIYVLKQLHNRFAWIGVQVHKVLEELLHHLRKSKSLPNYQSVAENLQNRLRQDYRDSRDAKYRLRPKRFIGLVEHEYQLPVNDEEWRALATQAQTCVENFYRLPLLNQLKDLDYSKWLELEELNYFQIDGCKIWVSLDACYRSDDQIVLLDWKTGKSHEADHSLQMGIYAMYTSEKWGIQPDLILLKEVFLAT